MWDQYKSREECLESSPAERDLGVLLGSQLNRTHIFQLFQKITFDFYTGGCQKISQLTQKNSTKIQHFCLKQKTTLLLKNSQKIQFLWVRNVKNNLIMKTPFLKKSSFNTFLLATSRMSYFGTLMSPLGKLTMLCGG